MASGRITSETQRSLKDTADELERLRTDIDRRIPAEEFDRHKARAGELRAEAIRHLTRLAAAGASSQARRLLAAAPDGEEKDARARS